MRSTLLFLAGVVMAMGLARATDAIACCMLLLEHAPLHFVSVTLDGEPSSYPDGFPRLEYELGANWDGVEIVMYDREGYVVGGETFRRSEP